MFRANIMEEVEKVVLFPSLFVLDSKKPDQQSPSGALVALQQAVWRTHERI